MYDLFGLRDFTVGVDMGPFGSRVYRLFVKFGGHAIRAEIEVCYLSVVFSLFKKRK